MTAPGGSNSILGNRIAFNTNLGIDLADDVVTPNDPGDADIGANGLLHHPVITSASESSGTVTIYFDLDVAFGSYRIDIFTNPSEIDPTGHGEGQVFERSDTVTYTGVESLQVTYAGATDDQITLTATEELPGPTYGSTSEFSAVYCC